MSESNEILDSGDFYELLLRHLVRSGEVLEFSIASGMKSEDFLASKSNGLKIYQVFADIALSIGEAPIDMSLFGAHIKIRLGNGDLLKSQIGPIGELYAFMYDGILNKDHFIANILPFIRRRRKVKVSLEADGDIDVIEEKLAQLNVDLEKTNVRNKGKVINPFDELIKKEKFSGIKLGFEAIDSIIGGIPTGGYGLIIGPSGGGKTAFACNVAAHAALAGMATVYISAEEPSEDIVQRYYAKQFRIPYTSLHQGDADAELEQAYREMSKFNKKIFKEKFRVIDVRDIAPLTYLKVLREIEDLIDDEGFIPKLVIFDQMDYLDSVAKTDSGWEKQEKLSFECDAMSHHKLKGEHEFALLVLHQATSRAIKKTFTRNEIAGYKNVIKPTDFTLGIGREGYTSDEFCLFTLKSRHSKGFEVDLIGDLEYMSFREMTAAERIAPQEDAMTSNPLFRMPTPMSKNKKVK